ncbi:MAG TPA: ABC transporter permease/substrate-binding protein [Rhizomicrobium sp.]|jgi:osmoprotectant transport system permease protein|nr:ABC transporter permease/substrate-binding protein [Rhizomicrobium sp.]
MTATLFNAGFANLPDYLGQHVLLSLSAMVLGLAISLPLAIAASRVAWLRGPALAIASIVQTIPGLALLALFYPLLVIVSAFTTTTFGFGFPALGFLPAMLALTLYSMLPVLRNTIAGLDGIDPAILRAARATGMTPWQSLRLVELPLAAPIIMAGVRTAAVWVIGTATLSTPVGQTSLGNYIFTGLQTENWGLVLFGCIAAALLAIVIDRLLALAESGFAKRSRWRLWSAFAGIAFVVIASLFPLLGRAQAPVVIGTKSFDEQYILGSLMQTRLEDAGFATQRRDGLGSAVAFHALARGDIDVYVDYSGTIWTNEMKRTDQPGRAQVLAQMSAWLNKTYGIRALGSLGFENAYAVAMRRTRADILHIATLADLGAHAQDMTIGGDYEIFSRPEWRAVTNAYGLRFAKQRQFQSDFMYRAVEGGDVDAITAFSSDGRIAQYDLKLLGDPKGALPPYDAVVLISARHARDEKLIAALKPLIGAIDLKTMQQANLMVDRQTAKRSPEETAAWLAARIRH